MDDERVHQMRRQRRRNLDEINYGGGLRSMNRIRDGGGYPIVGVGQPDRILSEQDLKADIRHQIEKWVIISIAFLSFFILLVFYATSSFPFSLVLIPLFILDLALIGIASRYPLTNMMTRFETRRVFIKDALEAVLYISLKGIIIAKIYADGTVGYTFVAVPILLSFFCRLVICTPPKTDFQVIASTLKFFADVSKISVTVLIVLKQEIYDEWSWHAIFVPCWICFIFFSLFNILLIAGHSCFSERTTYTKAGMYWLVTMLILFKFSLIVLLIQTSRGLEQHTLDYLPSSVIPMIVFLSLFVLTHCIWEKKIVRFWYEFCEQEASRSTQNSLPQTETEENMVDREAHPPQSLNLRNYATVDAGVQRENSRSMMKKIRGLLRSPPKFLIKLSGTYYKRPKNLETSNLNEINFYNIPSDSQGLITGPTRKKLNQRQLTDTSFLKKALDDLKGRGKRNGDDDEEEEEDGVPDTERVFKKTKKTHAPTTKSAEHLRTKSCLPEFYSQVPVNPKARNSDLFKSSGLPRRGNLRKSSLSLENETIRNHKHTRTASDFEGERHSCVICYDREADAVIMECGHGGICYECSLQTWKNSGECHICREPMIQVLQIAREQNSAILKVVTSTVAIDRLDPASREILNYALATDNLDLSFNELERRLIRRELGLPEEGDGVLADSDDDDDDDDDPDADSPERAADRDEEEDEVVIEAVVEDVEERKSEHQEEDRSGQYTEAEGHSEVESNVHSTHTFLERRVSTQDSLSIHGALSRQSRDRFSPISFVRQEEASPDVNFNAARYHGMVGPGTTDPTRLSRASVSGVGRTGSRNSFVALEVNYEDPSHISEFFRHGRANSDIPVLGTRLSGHSLASPRGIRNSHQHTASFLTSNGRGTMISQGRVRTMSLWNGENRVLLGSQIVDRFNSTSPFGRSSVDHGSSFHRSPRDFSPEPDLKSDGFGNSRDFELSQSLVDEVGLAEIEENTIKGEDEKSEDHMEKEELYLEAAMRRAQL